MASNLGTVDIKYLKTIKDSNSVKLLSKTIYIKHNDANLIYLFYYICGAGESKDTHPHMYRA